MLLLLLADTGGRVLVGPENLEGVLNLDDFRIL